MAPKSPKKNMMEETIADMAKQLKTLTTTIQGNNTRMDSLEMLIKGLSAENKDLKKELVARDEEIFDLKSRINNMDQRHRAWSTRIFNVPLRKEEEADNFKVMQVVYEKALLPILRGAVANQLLPVVCLGGYTIGYFILFHPGHPLFQSLSRVQPPVLSSSFLPSGFPSSWPISNQRSYSTVG